MARDVQLLEKGFSPGKALGLFAKAHADAGGIASFVGKVRPDGDVKVLELVSYERLTLPGLETLADTVEGRWPLDGLLIYHRTGYLRPGAPIVLVAAAARHRRAAFDAVDFAMDHLKSRSWFWKREKRSDGWHWIEPREQDQEDAMRWDI